MQQVEKDQLLPLFLSPQLSRDVAAFVLDCQARGLSPRTVKLYDDELTSLLSFLETRQVEDVMSIQTYHLREYLVHLGQRRNPGGVHISYRVAKTFLRWWEREMEPQDWRNPIVRVRPPKVPQQSLEPVSLASLKRILETCKNRTFTGARDYALLLCFLDTGCRASEFLSLNVGDLDLQTGAVMVRKAKGGKSRVVFLGKKSRRALLRYLRKRGSLNEQSPLWVSRNADRLSYWGLVSMLRRRATKAGVKPPYPHDFRRGFALASLRGGMDIVSLQRIIGHSDLSVLRRYLAQTQEDLRQAHEAAGPVDRLLWR